VAQVGRISGPLLTENLERNGIDLAFRNDLNTTQLLYFDVNNGRIAVNHDVPSYELDVIGTTQTTNLISNFSNVAGYTISNSTLSTIGNLNLNAAEAIVMANMENGTIRISDNTISTIISNANIDLTPNGTGTTEVINDLNVFGNIYTPGNITFDGTITLGDADTDDVTFETDVNSDIIPDQNNTYALGAEDRRWATLYTNLVNGRSASVDGYILNEVDLLTRHGGIIYVAQEGDDAHSGDHILDPLATISEALSRAEASGDQPFTILVAAGDYQEALPLVVPNNVSVIGQDIRNTVITPDTSSQSEDVFHLNDKTLIANLTIKNHYYDSVNNTGYAFRFAPDAIMTERSPYIQNITVITSETSDGDGDAGRGAWIDGDELNAATVNKTMLFHSCTFISPGADVINMTNDVRVEWLNSFTYYANRGLYAFAGVSGGAELRSIGSANVYGTYGAVADGADTLMYLIQHNFGYIGAGNKSDNNQEDAIQANEVVELNSGQIHFVSTDQKGNFRVGDNFFVDLESGNSSINIDTADIETLTGLIINTPTGTTVIDASYITTGNIRISDNEILSFVGDLNLEGATNTINISSNTNVSGSLNIIDNFSFGGTLNIAGDQPGRDTASDRLIFNVQFEQNFNPNLHLKYSLGEVQRPWLNAWLNRLEVGDITVDENYITTDVSNADLELLANGTGIINIPNNNFVIDNALSVSGTTSLQDVPLTGTLTQTDDFSITGNLFTTNVNITGNLTALSQQQFEEIRFDGNVITTTTSDSNLELRASGIGQILLPNNSVQNNNNLSADNIFNNSNINITLQTEFGSATVSDINIIGNYISTNNSNADLELRANGTGIISVNNNVNIDNNLTIGSKTFLQDGNTTYEYGPELVTNGTFDSNLNGWAQSGGGTATATSGNLRINSTGAARNVSQEIAVVPGKTYDFEAQFRSVSNGNPFYLRIFESGVGTLQEWNETTGLVPDQLLTFSFVPQTTSIDIIFRSVDNVIEWDNISAFEDIGFVTAFTPVEVDVTDITQTGNTVKTGDIVQTGNTEIFGNFTANNDFFGPVIDIDNNKIINTQEGLRMSTNSSDEFSLPEIVKAIVNGATVNDYTNQQEKNLVNFLIDNNYVDVNQSGTLTTTDYIAWLQYIVNGSTPDDNFNNFLKPIIDEIIALEYETPGYFNFILFFGDYNNPNLELRANSSGQVLFPNNNILIQQNLFASRIIAQDINVGRDLNLNEIVITDSIIELDDNFISTTISNENLELRASENRNVTTSNFLTVNNTLTVNNNSTIKNLDILGNVIQTGDRNQNGNLAVIGNVTVSSTNIESEIQFDNILFNDNYITTTDSNSNLELTANGSGVIDINGTINIDNNLDVFAINSDDINNSLNLDFKNALISSNIEIFDNVIRTTESNSNLELRTSDTSNIKLSNLYFNLDTMSTLTDNIVITKDTVLTSNNSLQLPIGTIIDRQNTPGGLRFNSDTQAFEGYYQSNISLGGVYSDDRRTSITAHPTNNTLIGRTNNVQRIVINDTSLRTHGLQVDDISIQNNFISTNVSNADLDLKADGTGKLILDDITITNQTILNNSNSAIIVKNNLYGKAKIAGNAVKIPSGTDAEQPPFTPEIGMTRWNTENNILEAWDGSTFISAAGTSASISAEEMDDLILEYTLIFG
jgi:hypothetical protein